jgi:MFS family permease
VDVVEPVDPHRRRQLRRAMVASTVGTSLEWYDFFLYGTVAALVFPELFFPNSSNYVGVLEAFATFAVGFAARPVGAAIFGHYGDRIGRRNTLIVTLLLMGAASVAIGLLPTAASIGAWAGILLVCFRIVQGIGVGGEWGGSVLARDGVEPVEAAWLRGVAPAARRTDRTPALDGGRGPDDEPDR